MAKSKKNEAVAEVQAADDRAKRAVQKLKREHTLESDAITVITTTALGECEQKIGGAALGWLFYKGRIEGYIAQHVIDGDDAALIASIEADLVQFQAKYDDLSTWAPTGGWPE
jgi:hypothetical protein